MIAVALLAALTLTSGPEAGDVPTEEVADSLFSDCALSEIARLERTTPDRLAGFSKRNANKALATCQPVKKAWAADLEQRYSAEPEFQDPIARTAKISEVISSDELAVLLMIAMKAK